MRFSQRFFCCHFILAKMDLSEKIKRLQPESLACIYCGGYGINSTGKANGPHCMRLLSDEVKKNLVKKGDAVWCPACKGTGELKIKK